jgi:hypothetical protein
MGRSHALAFAPNREKNMTEQQQQDTQDDEPACHCQGSRLLVLLGPLKKSTESDHLIKDPATGAYAVDDATMYLAQHWALDFYAAQRTKRAHIHMLGYDAPSGDPNNVHRPMVPKHAAGPAESVMLHGKATPLGATEWSWDVVDEDYLDTTIPSCCCFFAEVMVIFHGHQAGAYNFIENSLSQVLAGRPIERLVLWTCSSSERFSPAQSNGAYQHIAWLVRPKECGCSCLVDRCHAFDPDCGARHCPDGKTPTTIFTSGEVNGETVKLGLDPAKPNPLSSPDGHLREITVQPDGTTAAGQQVTAKMGPAGTTFFDGLTCGADPTLLGAGGPGQPDAKAVQKYADKNLKPSGVKPSSGKEQGYVGPDTEGTRCDPALGCMTGADCNGPED